jgi:hypothetical protein
MLDEIYSHFPNVSLPPVLRGDDPVPDPNARNSPDSLRHWLQLCDWYTDLMPHVVLYESVDHLVQLLNSTMTDERLKEISRRMEEANRIAWNGQREQWGEIVGRIATAKKFRVEKN